LLEEIGGGIATIIEQVSTIGRESFLFLAKKKEKKEKSKKLNRWILKGPLE
jgi:hypothetical protein